MNGKVSNRSFVTFAELVLFACGASVSLRAKNAGPSLLSNAPGLVQKYHLNFTAWSFHTRATPSLLLDWAYTPTPFWGQFLKDALAGKEFELTKLH